MKPRTFAVLAVISAMLFALLLTCAKKSPTAPEEKDFTGTISGYVYSKSGKPLSGVFVASDADSAVPDQTDSTGFFSIGKAAEGSHTLSFALRDYESARKTVTILKGEDKDLNDTVRMAYRYFIIKGTVVSGASSVPFAGVIIADRNFSCLTNDKGAFVFDRVPKENDLTIVCAKNDVGWGSAEGVRGVADDTTFVPNIRLDSKGGVVTGTVFDTANRPVSGLPVMAMGGGLSDTAGSDGAFRLTSVPAQTQSIVIYVPETNGLIGAVSGMRIAEGATASGVNIYLRKAGDFSNGMLVETSDMLAADTAASVTLAVQGLTDGTVWIERFEWFVTGKSSLDTATGFSTLTVPMTLIEKAPESGDAKVVEVRAVSDSGEYSDKARILVRVINTKPTAIAKVAASDTGTFGDSAEIEVNLFAYFSLSASDQFGGIDTMELDFGDNSPSLLLSDTTTQVGHIYDSAAIYRVIFRVRDVEGNQVYDTVQVTVKKPSIDPPLYSRPANNDTAKCAGDTVLLVWRPVNASQVKYNVYLDDRNTVPAVKISSSLEDTTLAVRVENNKTYYWAIEAINPQAKARGVVWKFTAQTGLGNTPPRFVTTAADMKDSAVVGAEYRDTVVAEDAESGVTYSFIDSVAGMKLSGGVITWTPAAADTGRKTVQVAATDDKDAKDSLTWTIHVVNLAPFITIHPMAKTVGEYSSVYFSVAASGEDLTYQWQKDGTAISDAVDSMYTIDSVVLADSGLYRCIVTNSYGADTSSEAMLTIKPSVSAIIYVKADATGANNGSSWANAYTDLQVAIDAAPTNGQVWVAAGVYKPAKQQGGTGERFASFSMKTAVSIYGGFAGTETLLNQRDWEDNKTICSGDIGVEGDSTDNCYHVFYHTADMAIDERSLIDGFTITRGNANGTDPHNCGGGVYNKQSRPLMSNCLITKNDAHYGGGVYNTDGSAAIFVGCTISNNFALNSGGGIYNKTVSAAAMNTCMISSNSTSGRGGGIYNDNSSPVIVRSEISLNNAPLNGAGIYNTYSSLAMDSTTISLNKGNSLGGGIYNNYSNPTITSCFFTGNSVASGGGIFNYLGCHSVIHNCTFFNNIATASGEGGGGICNYYNSKIILTNSTFLSNSSSGNGGGCLLHYGSAAADSVWIISCTFSGNLANSEGGGIYFAYGGAQKVDRIINCIFWGNNSGSGSNELYTAMNVPVVIKNTVIEGGFVDSMAIMSDIYTGDPELEGLLDNGGPVKTMALLTGSSALDKGVYVYMDNKNLFYNTDGGSSYLDFSGNPYTPVGSVTRLNATDARGISRPRRNGIDLGAYEKE